MAKAKAVTKASAKAAKAEAENLSKKKLAAKKKVGGLSHAKSWERGVRVFARRLGRWPHMLPISPRLPGPAHVPFVVFSTHVFALEYAMTARLTAPPPPRFACLRPPSPAPPRRRAAAMRRPPPPSPPARRPMRAAAMRRM